VPKGEDKHEFNRSEFIFSLIVLCNLRMH